MTYGTIKVDTVTFTDAGIDKSVTLSGLVQNPTFSGNVTVTGTISGVTVTGTTASFTSGVFTSISGGTHTITSGVFAAGSAASPSISFTSDPDTGLYSPGANQVALSTNGTGRLFVDATGKVTVNQATDGVPSINIESDNDGRSRTILRFTDTDVATAANQPLGVIQFFGSDTSGAGAGIKSTIGAYSESANGDSYLTFSTATSTLNNQERLRITSAGLVGIGTSSPGAILHTVNTSAGAATIGAFIQNASLTVGTEVRLGFAPNSNLVSDNRYAWIGAVNDTGSNGSSLTFATTPGGQGATERVRITSAGLVGIGTSSPAKNLHISSSSNTALRIADTGTAPTTFGQTNGGLELVGGNANTTAKYMPGIKFGSTDSAFTTTTPKFGAAITAEASEAYDADTDGGMSLAFWTTPNDPGTGGSLQQRLTILNSGLVGIGTTSPGALLSIAGSSAYTVGNSGLATQGLDINAAAGGSGLLGGALSFGVGGTGRASISAVQGSADSDVVGLTFNIHNTGTAAADAVEAMRITQGGLVGIGTQSPGANLELGAVASANQSLRINSTGNNYIELSTNGSTGEHKITAGNSASGTAQLILETSSGGVETERARIDSSGRLLVGTTSARTNIGSNQTANIQTESTVNGLGFFTAYNQNNAFGSVLAIAKSRGATVGSSTIVLSGDQIGGVLFYGADGVDTAQAAGVECYVDGTPGSNDMPGRLVFSTTADGASSPTERMRITSTGQVRLAGAGITFNGDTATANELDDYEEGTWTPALAGATTAGTYETTFASGWYTKIGRQVTVQFRINLAGSITGGGVGFAVITGLPFNTSTDNYANGGSVLLGSVDFNDTAKHLYLYKRSTTSGQLVISEIFDNAAPQDVGIADFAASSIIAGSLVYFIS